MDFSGGSSLPGIHGIDRTSGRACRSRKPESGPCLRRAEEDRYAMLMLELGVLTLGFGFGVELEVGLGVVCAN